MFLIVMKKVKTLIIGASFFAVGYAANHTDALIIDRRETVGFDFVGCADVTPVDIKKEYSTQTADILSRLAARNIISSDGGVHIFPVSGVLCEYILEKSINIRLATEFVNAKRVEGGFEITLFAANGYHTVFAEKIIDTRVGDVPHKKYICATALGELDELKNLENEGIYVSHGIYGQSTIACLVDISTDYSAAREILNDKIGARIKTSKIAAFALEFKYVTQEKNVIIGDKDGVWHIPSVSFGNFADAFEGGILCDI